MIGNGWAPAIPSHAKDENAKENLKELIVRAKAGMKIGDFQKEAHLTFYLGLAHEFKKEYKDAIRAYKRFVLCAQNLDD